MTPATDQVALSALRGEVSRPGGYTDGVKARISAPLATLRNAPDGSRDRQLGFGNDVTIVETSEEWAFVQAQRDGYCGWLRTADLGFDLPPLTHRVSVPSTHLYPGPDFKLAEIAALPINARLSVAGTDARFARLSAGGFVPVQAISAEPARDPVAVAEALIGTPYLWGGNSAAGIDCSGLVQAALHACDIACPGDADLQKAAFQPVDSPARGDLLFWDGHVAMACGDGQMVHATAWQMRVIHEDIASAIARIDAAGNGPFRGARRPAPGQALPQAGVGPRLKTRSG